MFSAMRRRVTFANLTATIAVFFALSGGAYAAGKYLITSSKQISPKVLKQLKGQSGSKGAAGAAGAAGPEGKQGPPGAAGEKGGPGPEGKAGEPGKAGSNGKNGKSVVIESESAGGANCKEGGSSFEVEGSGAKSYACNGKQGPEGNIKATLAPGQMEVGAWAGSTTNEIRRVLVAISFPIPLAESLETKQCATKASVCHIHFIKPGETGVAGEGCGGGTDKAPTAEPGNLCIYVQATENVNEARTGWENPEGGEGVGTTGEIIKMEPTSETEGGEGQGTWAVREAG
jgi:hypothetical protein